MSRSAQSAVAWVRTLPQGARIHWNELEAHVFRDHRSILSLLGAAAGEVRTQGRAFGIVAGVIIAIACIVGLAVMWAPIWGLATLSGDAFGVQDVDGAMAIPVAGAAMIVSCLVQIGLLLRRALNGGVGGTDDASVAGGTVVLGLLTLAGILAIGVRQQPASWELWLVPTVVGIALAIILLLVSRRTGETPGPFARRREEPSRIDSDRRERMRAAIAALPAEERERLSADQQRAIELLRTRGTISPDDAMRAMRAELGMLHDSLAQHDPR